MLVAIAPASTAWAQAAGGLHPTASITQILTDNVEPGSGEKSADAITRLSAGVGYANQSGLLRGFANYSLSQVLYARHGDRNALQHTLAANLSAELVPAHGYLDLVSSISQSAKSAFGAQPTGDGRTGSNTSEVATVALTPRWTGVLLGRVAYSASGSYQVTDAFGTDRGDGSVRSAAIDFGSASAGLLGWNASARHSLSSYKAGAGTETDSVNVGVNVNVPEADLTMRAGTGREFGDLAKRSGGGKGTWSAGASWVPSPRTSVDASIGHRPTGGTYQLGLSFRTPLTVWRATASRDLSSGASLSNVTLGTNYDLFFALFASQEPDPAKRAVLVDNYLSRNGIPRDGLVRASFLSAAQTIDERVGLSAAWHNERSTAVLSLGHSQSRRADGAVQAADDLSDSRRVRMDDVSLGLSHQLTPVLSAGIDLGMHRSRGDLAEQSNNSRRAGVRLGGTASSRMSWSLAARRTLSETGPRSYSESTLTGSISLQF